LTLERDVPLSNFAFNFHLRPYTKLEVSATVNSMIKMLLAVATPSGFGVARHMI
jgi:hypothetical protein